MVLDAYDKEKGVQHEKGNFGSRALFLRSWNLFLFLWIYEVLGNSPDHQRDFDVIRFKNRWRVLILKVVVQKCKKKEPAKTGSKRSLIKLFQLNQILSKKYIRTFS